MENKKIDSIDLVFTEGDEHCLPKRNKTYDTQGRQQKYVVTPDGDLISSNQSGYNPKQINEEYNRKIHSD